MRAQRLVQTDSALCLFIGVRADKKSPQPSVLNAGRAGFPSMSGRVVSGAMDVLFMFPKESYRIQSGNIIYKQQDILCAMSLLHGFGTVGGQVGKPKCIHRLSNALKEDYADGMNRTASPRLPQHHQASVFRTVGCTLASSDRLPGDNIVVRRPVRFTTAPNTEASEANVSQRDKARWVLLVPERYVMAVMV